MFTVAPIETGISFRKGIRYIHTFSVRLSAVTPEKNMYYSEVLQQIYFKVLNLMIIL